MKVTRDNTPFKPVTITLESQTEVDAIVKIVNWPIAVSQAVKGTPDTSERRDIETTLRNLFAALFQAGIT